MAPSITALQITLKELGYDVGPADNIPGKKTMGAVDEMLAKVNPKGWQNWTDERRRIAAWQLIFHKEGIEVGEIDGLAGPQTRYAADVWYAKRSIDPEEVKKVTEWRDKEPPKEASVEAATKSKWPRQRDVQKFYGPPGTGFISITLPFPMRVAWEPTKELSTVSCHQKCAQGFKNIWTRTLKHYGHEQIRKLRLDYFGGCVAVRKMRGGSRWSMHAFGCAWDIDPDRNALKWKRGQATLDDAPYKDFWKIVYDEGAISLGIERDYDWMHFQFTSDLS